ncbi:MAG: zinc metalloprotease HtpX [bacterium]|nr:zinc metalloprotease HtpX [bacterium]MDD3806189.1 zinc metalloprotease HtpX [bacterium]MDD4559039.1 zinc metalloprotease HtpX [bacterium]
MYSEIDSNKRRTWLLIFGFFVFIIVLGWVFGHAFDEPLILVGAVIFATVQALVSYYRSTEIVLAVSGAHPVSEQQDPDLYHVLENLSITAGTPMPKLYMIDDTATNAFATGRDPQHAAVVVTKGLREKLTRTELEGVLAHELSHIRNYDIRLMTVVVVLVGAVALLSDWFLRWSFWGGRRRRSDSGGQGELILLLIALVLAILAPISAVLIQLAISRRREYLADADGALLTRYPEGLASALAKIAADMEPLEAANKATAHLYIENPLKGHRGVVNSLFSTHPPVAERIKRLRSML